MASYLNLIAQFGSVVSGQPLLLSNANTVTNYSFANGYFTVKSGNPVGTLTNPQLVLAGTTGNYAHSIRSRHNPSGAAGNAMDFFVWQQAVDAATALGSGTVLTIAQSAVGINNTAPAYALDVSGVSRCLVPASVGTISCSMNNSPFSGLTGLHLSDQNKGIAYSGANYSQFFSGSFPSDGIAVYGYADGALGTCQNGTKTVALSWNNSNQVGINKTNPAYTLDVSGSVRTSGQTWIQASAPVLFLGTALAMTQSGYINFNSTANSLGLGVYGGTNDRVTIAPTGLVGINQTSPAYQLDVAGTAHASGNVQLDSVLHMNNQINNCVVSFFNQAGSSIPAGSSTNYFGFGLNGGALRYQVPLASHAHVFYGSTTEAARITGAGQLGINQSNPQYALDVSGPARASYLLLGSATTQGLAQGLITAFNSTLSGNYVNLLLGKAASSNNTAFLNYVHNGTDGSSGNLLGIGIYGQSANGQITILGSGNVGINTSVPQFTLDVNGIIGNSGTNNTIIASPAGLSVVLQLGASGTNNVFFNQYGFYPNINNQYPLGLPAQRWSTLNAVSGNFTGGAVVQNGNQSSGSLTSSAAQLTLAYNQTGYAHAIKSRHDANGSVTNAIDFWLWNYGTDTQATGPSKPVMSVCGSGAVGINTFSPAYTLDVNGNERVTGSLTVGTSTNAAALVMVSNLTSGTGIRIEGGYYSGSVTALSIGGYGQLAVDASGVGGGRLIVKDSGYVGINQAGPVCTLDVTGTGRFVGNSSSLASNAPDSAFNNYYNLLLTNPAKSTASTTYSMAIGVDYTTGAGYINAAGASAVQPVCLSTRGGGVGIGNTAPAYALDVNGSTRAYNGIIGTGTVSSLGAGNGLMLTSTLTSNIGGPHVVVFTGNNQYPIYQQLNWSTDNIGHQYDCYFDASSNWRSSGSVTAFQIYKVSSRLQFNYAPPSTAGTAISWTTALVVGTNGAIGINTTSPAYQLDVNGTARVVGTLLTSTIAASSISVSPGNTAVNLSWDGTFSGLYLSDANKGVVYSGQNGSANYWNSSKPSDGVVVYGWQDGALGTRYPNTRAISLYWNSSQQVGINTTSPAYTLDVNGAARVSGNLYPKSLYNCSGTFSVGAGAQNVDVTWTNPGTFGFAKLVVYGSPGLQYLVLSAEVQCQGINANCQVFNTTSYSYSGNSGAIAATLQNYGGSTNTGYTVGGNVNLFRLAVTSNPAGAFTGTWYVIPYV